MKLSIKENWLRNKIIVHWINYFFSFIFVRNTWNRWGFAFTPVLIALGYKAKEAAATTAFIVTFSSFSGYLRHVAEGHMNWTLTIVLVIAVIIGSQLGARFMSQKANPKMVKKIYAIVLIAIAIKFSWGAIANVIH